VGIPLIVKYPHGQPGVVDERVSQVDLMPTILDALGYEIPKGLDGISMLRLDQNPQREVFAESYPGRESLLANPKRFRWIHRAVFAGDQKLVVSENGTRELYDLAQDPEENHNLYEPQAALSNYLYQRLNDWQASLGLHMRKRPANVDPATMRNLKSLGYVGGN
jgi:arylsulfatase A-like enzyme